jgi:hypothetical protein
MLVVKVRNLKKKKELYPPQENRKANHNPKALQTFKTE